MAKSGRIPEKYLSCQNLVVLPDKCFLKKAKKAAKSKRRVIFRYPVKLDIRTFRLIYKVPLSERIKDMFFDMMIKALNFALIKRIIK